MSGIEVLVVVDMQNDFITGVLGTKEAVAIVPEVEKVIKEFKGLVYFTRDTHEADYLDTREGKKLPVEHCIRGTKGWEICDELQDYVKEAKIIDKPTFGSVKLAQELEKKAGEEPIESITFVGLCTDICVISNAMVTKATLPEVTIKVVEAACAGVTPATHNNALEAMKVCQIEVV